MNNTQLALDIKPAAPLRSEPVFMGFGPADDLGEATRIFRKRHGHDPLDHKRTGGALLLVIEYEEER